MVYEEEGLAIYLDDCRNADLKSMPGITLIIADYPFKLDRDLVEFTIKLAWDILPLGGNFLVINNPHNIFKTAPLYSKFKLRNGVALIKPAPFTSSYHLAFLHNYALLLFKQDAKRVWNGVKTNHDHSARPDVMDRWQAGYRSRYGWHPEAVPLNYAFEFVELLSNRGDTVVDLFTGSGTFAVICKRLGRRYIGYENKEKYWTMAVKRCQEENAGRR